ncbi:myb-like protein X [Danaus plexippus]|uniref:myb-like protein X n=1 Tax=Danaus plexippus TaxID=13037 RepID=UPI002AAFE05D|nr:myb-like protein X [Danaus plexippus]
MELTQKLECTQEICANNYEKEFPEQIGFLGICGVKYPLKKGPNKIGRDPDTCNIVLNLNSISRQHAVINILNSYDFMLMDLDSANKTKLADKTLQAYIPHPIKNGDMVQFGQVFGVFRLFEEDNDLPMTQALDVPETPVRNQAVYKVNNLITTIPESPDVSDRDDSFIVASQPKPNNVFKSPKTNFIKSSGKTVHIKPVGFNKIDNAYWSSSKKSDSFSLESDTSRNDSDVCLKTSEINQNIHEQDTQCTGYNKTDNSIYEAETQIDNVQKSVHNLETQLLGINNLPEVFKIQGQENINLDLSTENKENEDVYQSDKEVLLHKAMGSAVRDNESCNNKDISDDIILFDEIDSPVGEDNIESQQLLIPELETEHVEIVGDSEKPSNKEEEPSKRRDSGSSTDCEDIYFALTQNLPEKRIEDDETDCEDDPEIIVKVNKEQKTVEDSNLDADLTDCEDDIESKAQKDPGLEDLATQIVEDVSHCKINSSKTTSDDQQGPNEIDLEDMPTQIISYEPQNIYSEEVVTPFKVPAISPMKRKRKEQEPKALTIINNKNITANIENDDEENYYDATQKLWDDLCTQRESSPTLTCGANKDALETQINKNININPPDCQPETYDIDEKIDRFVMNLTNTEKTSMVGAKTGVESKKSSSDSSDVETTPRKLNPLSFLNTELPNTQEIKLYVKATGDTSPETSFDLDTDGSDCERHRKKRNTKNKIVKRSNLITRLESEKSPERIINPVRQPENKIKHSKDIDNKKPKRNTGSDLLGNENNNDGKLVTANTSEVKEKSTRSTRSSDIIDRKDSKELNKSKASCKNTKESKAKGITDSKETARRGRKNNITIEKQNSIVKKTTEGDIKNNVTVTDREQAKEKKSNKKSTDSSDKEKRNSSRSVSKQTKSDNNEPKLPQAKGDSNRSSRSKSRRKETNTIDKFLCPTPVIEAQKKTVSKSRSTEKEINNTEQENNGKDRGNRRKDSKSTDNTSRNSDKVNKNKDIDTKEKNRTSAETRNQTRSMENNKKEIPVELEVRRSKRQRTAKRSFEIESRTSKTNHEQSTVYNISSESGIDSPNKLKRQASDISLPSSKKTKTCNGSNITLRATPARKIKTQYVLFTAFPCDEVKVKLEKLGAVIVTDIMKCTVVLTLEIKRTFKLLCAVGLGKPIVGPHWVQACVDTNMIVDPWLYLIKDEKTEKRFQFNLERILIGKRQFLKGYNVSSTPNVMPSPPEMKLIVECSGGTWTAGGKNWICVSSNTDRALWDGLKRKGATIVSTEFVLAGVLRQKIDINRNILL